MRSRKIELIFTAILLPIDFLLILAATFSAYFLRFGPFIALRPAVTQIPLVDYSAFAFVAATITIICFAIAGLYSIHGPRRLSHEISRLMLAISAAFMLIILLIFFRRELFASRFIALAAYLISIIFIAFGRIITRLIQRMLVSRGIGAHKVVLIGGTDRISTLLSATFATNPANGHKIIAHFDTWNTETKNKIETMIKKEALDEILITNPEMNRKALSDVLAFCQSRHIGFKYSADLLSTHSKNIDVSTMAGIPVIEIKATRLEGWGRIYKRIFDIVASITLLIITSPIMLAIAIATLIETGFPILFSRINDKRNGPKVMRVGEGGQLFHFYKFRSMQKDVHYQRYNELAHLNTRNGPIVKTLNDPRITRVGNFIRKTSLDELPQLFNVLGGNMSLVGPRPHLPEEVEKYEDYQRRVLAIKPGITGMAQISGRAELDFDDEVILDTYYIENWSPWLDLVILFKTPFVVVSKKGAS